MIPFESAPSDVRPLGAANPDQKFQHGQLLVCKHHHRQDFFQSALGPAAFCSKDTVYQTQESYMQLMSRHAKLHRS